MSKINSVGFTNFYPRVESRQRFGNTIPISSQVIPPEKQQNENAQMQSGAKSSSALKWGAVLGGIALGAAIIASAIKRGKYAPIKNLSENIKFTKAKLFSCAKTQENYCKNFLEILLN